MKIERIRIVMAETSIDATVEIGFGKLLQSSVAEARGIVESKISEDPFFGITYDPYPASLSDHPLIASMCQASVVAGVGPMAAVAGAIAAHSAETLFDAGCSHAVIDNGGDIALFSESDVTVGICSGVCAVIRSSRITSVCTSSGTIGHSVSFGDSSGSTVFADDPVLADACATALGNLMRSDADIASAAEAICSLEGVRGCIASVSDRIVLCGELPELAESD